MPARCCAQISDGRTGACDRYANREGVLVRVDPVVLLPPARERCARAGGFRPHGGGRRRQGRKGDIARLERRPAACRRGLRHRRQFLHHLPRLQARALHRRLQGAGRGHGRRGHRGHLQLLRLQGEDRHRPLCLGAEQASVRYRGEVVGHVTTAEVRLADAVAGRRAPPHGRQQEGRPHDGRADATAGQQEGHRIPSTAAPAW